MNKRLQIANTIGLVVMVVINYLSNTGVFNGNTMKTVSDKYQNIFTPAGYAFSIWGLIYLGLLGFVIYTGRSVFTKRPAEQEVSEIGLWFFFSCCANSLWVLAWLYDYTGLSVMLMVLLLICLLKIIFNTRMELDFHPLKKYVFIFWPFAVYAGWVSVALIANVAAWLTKLQWAAGGIDPAVWAMIVTLIAGLIHVLAIWKRNLREFAVAGIWGIMAVAVANRDEVQSVVYTCYTVSAIILVNILISAFKNRGAGIGRM